MKERFSIVSFAGGFLAGVVCVVFWATSTGALPSLTPLTNTTPVNAVTGLTHTVDESGAVSVATQTAGSSVVIESVTVPPPGVWVAVREVQGSDLGNVLGAVRVTGPRSNISVSLLRDTVPNASYAVELYRDNGDDLFDLSSDSVYVDFTTSEPVITYFQTTP